MLKKGLLAFGFVFVAIVAFKVGLLAGHGLGDEGAKDRRFQNERRELEAIIRADPALRNVQVEMFTADGSAQLVGQVPNPVDLARLRSSLEKSFWKPRMDEMMRCVE
jgi:hypothetical protein